MPPIELSIQALQIFPPAVTLLPILKKPGVTTNVVFSFELDHA